MNIREISKFEFDALFPSRPVLESYTGKLIEWFANDDNSVLGAIDHETETWSYVVLQKNPKGELRVVEINENMASQSAARLELFQKMEMALEAM